MGFRQHISQAMQNIMSAKLRSFLAVLGILVGTASVVALISSGELATKRALDQFKSLGTDLMSMSFFKAGGGNSASAPDEFELHEIEPMPQYVQELKTVAPYATLYVPINFDGHRVNGSIVGVTESLQHVIRIGLAKGRFISFLDEYDYYCVIGQKIYRQLKKFNRGEIIGQQILLGKHYYTVVGVAKKWPENQFFNADVNNSILVPIKTARVVSRYSKIRNLIMQTDEDVDIPSLQQKIKHYVNAHSMGLTMFFRSASQLLEKKTQQKQILTLMLGLIGSISLIVGGIGVMNVMLVSVAERRREIGIRMAVGAKRRDIRMLFLVEGVILAVFGGVVGVGTGVLVSYCIALFTGWDFALLWAPPMLGFVVSVVTGIFFGYYPASRAAKLDPIQTLRYD